MPSLNWVQYNDVWLKLSRVLSFSQRAVYEDFAKRYLFTHFRLTVRCVVHLQGTQPVGFPAPLNAGAAFAELRRRLLVKQKPLLMLFGPDVVLESPQWLAAKAARMDRDAKNGPHPIRFDFVELIGHKFLVADFEVETWLDECEGRPGEPPPTILSHEWERSESIAENWLSTVTTTGRLVCRTDFLERRALVPDDFRGRLFHPIPPRFSREHVDVRQLGDGSGVTYTTVDEEREWGIDPTKRIRRIKGRFRAGYHWPTLETPRFTRHFHLEVWGAPRTTRWWLAHALVEVYSSMLTGTGESWVTTLERGLLVSVVPGMIARPYRSLEIDMDFPEPHASCSWTQTVSKDAPDLSLFLLRGAALSGPIWPEDFGDHGGPAQWTNPVPLHSARGRGSSLVRLVAQMLSDPCLVPRTPLAGVSPPRLPPEAE
jgi:hypothetical protein